MNDGPEWFAPKRYGYGSGLPVAWQGWAVTSVYLLTVLSAAFLLAESNLLAFVGLTVTATLLFTWIASRTTRGGWHWRWGGEE